jgi:ABC-type antimicrobial peptide transport system permease subunit
MVKTLIGGVLGLLVGAFLGLAGMAWRSVARSPSPPSGYGVGWDPISLMHQPAFAAPVLFCALVVAYLFARLFSRNGNSKRASQV